MGSIVVLTGPVGAGKTTVARELVKSAAAPTAFIEGDVFWSFIARAPAGRPRQRSFQTIMRAMFRSAAAFAADDFEAILDFTMPPAFLERAAARVESTRVHLVILRPSEPVCAARAAARSEGVILDYGPYRDLYALFDGAERHVIRNDAISPTAAAAAIREGLAAGTFRIG